MFALFRHIQLIRAVRRISALLRSHQHLSNPLRHDLLRTPAEAFEDGLMVVPEMPGIGAGIDEDVLDNHRVT